MSESRAILENQVMMETSVQEDKRYSLESLMTHSFLMDHLIYLVMYLSVSFRLAHNAK